MTIKPILPVEVVRDEDGWFTHPQYFTEPEWEDVDNFTREEFDSYCTERGIETATTDMESDDFEMHERYCEGGQVECTAWTPSRPAGDGWFMLSIHDTEDGPICVWGRRTEEPFVSEAVGATYEPDLFSEQPAQLKTGSALKSLANFTEHSFDQLMRYEDGRTPLYLTKEQYNAIRDLIAQAGAAPALSADDQVTALRRNGLSIDGENAYKQDLIDTIVGALAFGKQGVNPPPAGHWGKQFWDIGRAEGEEKELLSNQRDAILLQARVWAGEAKTQQAITREVGEILGGVPNWGPIAAGVEALRQQLAERDVLLRRVIDTGELSRMQHSELEADICEVLRPHAQPTDWVKSDE